MTMYNFLNGSFENDLIGWTTGLTAGTATAVASYLSFTPKSGTKFLKIDAGLSGDDVYQTVSQDITLIAGQHVEFWTGQEGFTSNIRTRILQGATVIDTIDATPFNWGPQYFTPLISGTYTIEFGVANSGGSHNTVGVFDYVRAVYILNGSFEFTDLTGWNDNVVNGGAVNITQNTLSPGSGPPGYNYQVNIDPVTDADDWFLEIQSGTADADVYETVTQDLTLVAGKIVSIWSRFGWGDYSFYKDAMRVRILQGATVIATPVFLDGTGHADYWTSDWAEATWECPSDGIYTLELGIVNIYDLNKSSSAYFDKIEVTLDPEPSPNYQDNCGQEINGVINGVIPDTGLGIGFQVKTAFNYFRDFSQNKIYHMARPLLKASDALTMTMNIDYDFKGAEQQGEVIVSAGSLAVFDGAHFDIDYFASYSLYFNDWISVNGMGFCAAFELSGTVDNASFEWLNWAITYEQGGVL